MKISKASEPIRTKIALLLWAVLSCFSIGQSQPLLPGESTFTSFSSPFGISQTAENEVLEFERELNKRLRKYFDKNLFMVVVEVEELKKEIETISDKSIKTDTGFEANFLPGLPLNPSKKNPFSIKVPPKPKVYTYYKHFINVLMDTSFSPAVLQFAEQVVMGSGLIDENLGDEVTVGFMVFPMKNSFWKSSNSVLEKEEPKEPLDQLEDLLDKKFAPLMAAKDEKNPKEKEIPTDWIIIGGLTLALVLFLIYWFIENRGRKSNKNNELKELFSDFFSKIEDKFEKLSPPVPLPTSSNDQGSRSFIPAQEDTVQKHATLDSIRSTVTKSVFENNSPAQSMLEQLDNESDPTHIQQMSKALASLSPDILQIIKPNLSEDILLKLQDSIDEHRDLDPSEQIKALKDFQRTLTQFRKSSPNNANKNKGIFDFLSQLNSNQIDQLLKGESEDMVAVLLAQLPSEKIREQLNKYDIPKQTILLQRISGLSQVPLTVYKEVAKHFSIKALTVKDMADVSLDGLQSIINLIDGMPTHKQTSYIEDLAKYDLDLARKIKERFISFEDLSSLDSQIHQIALEQIDASMLTLALQNNQELTEKIFEHKTSREIELLTSEIKRKSNSSLQEIESAKKVVLEQYRSTVNQLKK